MGRADVLRTIRDAEADAKATLEKAEREASNLVMKARADAAETVSKRRQDSDAEANAILEKSRVASEKEAAAVSSEGDSELANVHDSGEKNRSQAIDLVISNFNQS